MAVAPMRSRAPLRARRIALAIAITAGANVVTGAISVPRAAAASVADVMAWSPYWEEQPTVTPKALDKFLAHSEQFSELTPFFFVAANGTTITLNSNMTNGASRVQAYRDAAVSKGKPLVATIVDGTGARVMAGILADPLQRAAHVQTILNFATAGFSGGFDGVDLDYEQFAFADGKATWDATFVAWGQFVQELSDALHAAGKTLAVSVPPIYDSLYGSGSGYWVYNFPQLAQYADLVRVMTYSYSVASAGPIAPYNWVSSSIDAVAAVVPKSKVMMGVAAYGNDWITKVEGSCPAGVTVKKGTFETDEAAQYAANRGITIGQATWDAVTHEHHYSYAESFSGPDATGVAVRCNVFRTVWYPDAQAIYDRVLLAQSKDLRGVAMWALGYDDGPTWDAISAARSGNSGWQPPPGLAPTPRSSIVTAPYPTPIFSAGPLPARYLDTRTGQKTADGLFQGGGRREAESTLAVKIAGRGAVPADAKAVTLNVTVLGEGTGYVTVYPCDTPRPGTSNLNVRTGQTISNSVITKLSADGTVCIYNQAAAHLLVDVFNVLPATSFTPLSVPARLVDTRSGEATVDGQFAGVGTMGFGTTMEVQVAGRGGVGATAKSAVLNVTAVGATTNGYLTVWPCDGPQPATSNVNFTPGAIVPNAVVTGLSAKGTVCIYASNATHLVVDAFGVLDPSKFASLYQPARLLETRSGYATVDNVFNGIGKVDAGVTLEVPIALRGGLPEDPGAVILNVTVDQPELAGFVTVFPCGTARPLVSNVNFAPLQTLPNLVVTKLSASGSICIYAHVKTHIVIDAFGTLSL